MAMYHLRQAYPKAPLLGLGFSLGANVLTRYLAEEGENSRPAAACVVACVRVDMRIDTIQLLIITLLAMGSAREQCSVRIFLPLPSFAHQLTSSRLALKADGFIAPFIRAHLAPTCKVSSSDMRHRSASSQTRLSARP